MYIRFVCRKPVKGGTKSSGQTNTYIHTYIQRHHPLLLQSNGLCGGQRNVICFEPMQKHKLRTTVVVVVVERTNPPPTTARRCWAPPVSEICLYSSSVS